MVTLQTSFQRYSSKQLHGELGPYTAGIFKIFIRFKLESNQIQKSKFSNFWTAIKTYWKENG